MKELVINGVTFQVTKPRDLISAHNRFDKLFFKDSRTLNECYARPSVAKKRIYESWRNWYYDCILKDLFELHHWCGVTSYNGWRFGLTMCITINGIDYIVDITQSHNLLIQCNP